MIKNIIFDIGNVLTDYRWHDFLMDQGYDEEMIERIASASIKSREWNEYDRGKWTDREILDAFVRNDPGIETELRSCFRDFKGLVTKRDYAIPLMKELKTLGYQIFYLSNFSRKAHRECEEALDFIPYTDGGILSYMDQIIKPDQAIYRLLAERYQLVPGECVFLDDMLINVTAAREAGMEAIHFQSFQQACEELKAMEIKVEAVTDSVKGAE